MRIYHITTTNEAREATRIGSYLPEAFLKDGFIHCSYERQLVDVANRLFRGRKDLVVLEIDPRKVNCDIVDENFDGGSELYPHIYGRLKMSAVTRVMEFPCDSGGSFSNPFSMKT